MAVAKLAAETRIADLSFDRKGWLGAAKAEALARLTAMGLPGRTPLSRRRSTVARADTTPSGPSKAPPSGTESKWEPITMPGVPACTAASGSPHQAHWLPIRSVVRSRPRAAHSPANHSRKSASSRLQAKRRYPPVPGSRPIGCRSSHIRRKPTACDGSGIRVIVSQFSRIGTRTPQASATLSAS